MRAADSVTISIVVNAHGKMSGAARVEVVQQDARVVPADEAVPEDRRERRERDQRQAGDVEELWRRAPRIGRRAAPMRRRASARPAVRCLARLLDTRAPASIRVPRFRHATASAVRSLTPPAGAGTAVSRAKMRLAKLAQPEDTHSKSVNSMVIVCWKRIGWFVGLACLSAALRPGRSRARRPRNRQRTKAFPFRAISCAPRCGSCHRSDDKGRMSRISYRRATPENWERTIKRMVALNHVTLDPADARTILKLPGGPPGSRTGRSPSD